MSIKLMSAIFETEFFDLPMPETDKNGKERFTKASTAKLVLLAIADHANDEGESAYPGLTRLELKTGLSRQGIVDVLDALKYNGIIFISDAPSKLGTNNYTINIQCFPKLFNQDDQKLLVKPLDYPSQATLPEVVKPLDLNHSLTVLKPSSENEKKILPLPEGSDIAWQLRAGIPAEEIAMQNMKMQKEKEVADNFEREMGYNPLDWYGEKKLSRLLRFLMDKTPAEVKMFALWAKDPYHGCSPAQVRKNPQLVIDLWKQAFPAGTITNKPNIQPSNEELGTGIDPKTGKDRGFYG